MGKLQRELLESAQALTIEHLKQHKAFSPHWDAISVILSGSATTEYADEYSGIDLIVLGDSPVISQLWADLLQNGAELLDENLVTFQLGPKRVKVSCFDFDYAAGAISEYDDFALSAFIPAPVLHDPGGRFGQLVAGCTTVPRSVWERKISERYRQLRNRQAGLAWNIRRGQPYALLGNLNSFLAHTLAICFYVHGQPPTGRKWVFQGALKLDAGRRIRPHLFELFSSLGDLATLGGSIRIRQNRIYQLVSAIHDELVEIISEAGFPLQREVDDHRQSWTTRTPL